MTPSHTLDALRDAGRQITAAGLMRLTGLTHDALYAELVALEAKGLARVVVDYPHHGRPPVVTWVALSA